MMFYTYNTVIYSVLNPVANIYQHNNTADFSYVRMIRLHQVIWCKLRQNNAFYILSPFADTS